ncbi:MAG: sulfatase [Halobacteriaceae archaeon]
MGRRPKPEATMRTVLLTVDALRADHLGQYGYERDTFPVLDRLTTGSGTRYERGYANGTYTGISLPSLFTSRYLGQEAARDGPTVASVLTDAGVETAGFHSNAMLANAVGDVHGFDVFEDFDVAAEKEAGAGEGGLSQRLYDRLVDTLRPVVERLGVRDRAERIQEAVFPAEMVHAPSVYTDAEATTDAVLEYLADPPEEFFCWVHYMDPHRPYGIDLEDPAYGDPADRETVMELMSTAGVHPERVSEAERERMVDLYDSDVRYTSAAIDRLFDGLIERDIWDDAAVLLTADHGEEFREHGEFFHRNHPYDELISVPLAVKPPADESAAADVLHAGQGVVMDQRELLDVAPTVCELHGVDPPDEFLGTPLARGVPRKVVATGSFVANGQVVAGRWDGWKYIHVEEEGEEFYDLAEDATEQENLAAAEQSRVHQYRSEIPEYLFEGERGGMGEVTEDAVAERLRDLGYME